MESVWGYPRPPALVPCERRVRVLLGAVTVADSRRALRVLETASPPTIYVPPEDVRTDLLRPTRRSSACEWKGAARYWDVVTGGRTVREAAWGYPDPVAAYAALRDHLAFYPGRLACFLDAERVRPQDGDFYGGWITDEIQGPFKGAPGTLGW
jgi:uncharacterized protein (DUF427 family)